MSTITIAEVKNLSANVRAKFSMQKTASQILRQDMIDHITQNHYDIFLSHSSLDADLILGIKDLLKQFEYSCYVDWLDDLHLDRETVTPETAATLRKRMSYCRCLFYVTTENSRLSKWMPWECGYFDGIKQKVAILPVTEKADSYFTGQEYLGLYPYITKGPRNGYGANQMIVNFSPSEFGDFDAWLDG